MVFKKYNKQVYNTKQEDKLFDIAIKNNLNVLLVGDTGTGKTTKLKALAEKYGKKLHRINLNGQTGVDEILGKFIVAPDSKGKVVMKWVNGILIEAMLNGDWVVLDEINATTPEILFSLHSLLDDARSITLKENNNEIIKAHDEFKFFATMNPPNNYTGTHDLNRAFKSRFDIIMEVDYSEHEAKIIAEQGGIDEKDAEEILLLVNKTRKMYREGSITTIISTRDLIQYAKLIKNKVTPSIALEHAILNKINDEVERISIKKIFNIVNGKGEVDIDNTKKITIDDLITNYKNNSNVSQELQTVKKEYQELQAKCEKLVIENEAMNKIKEQFVKLNIN